MDMNPASTRALAAMLETRTGQLLSASRQWRLELALTPIMQARRLPSLDAVARLAASGCDAGVADAVVDALLNNETSFFRDTHAFSALLDDALPPLMADCAAQGRRLRIWCAGCSTGQEAFSLAMALAERAPELAIDILATDVSRTAIDRAKAGVFAQMEIQRGLPVRTMLDWFEPLPDGGWHARETLRARIRFAVRNLLEPLPIRGGFDLVLCRNVLLYFDAARRARALELLADAMAPTGLLMLGAGETVIGQTPRFAVDPAVRGFYRPVIAACGPERGDGSREPA